MKRVILFLLVISLAWSHEGRGQGLYLGSDSLLVIQEGTASYYGKRFHKKRTASGEIFDMHEYTAAHKHLPFGTLIKVTNLKNDYEVIVKINDRLPKNSRRIIDLSRTAADQLDMLRDGLTPVQLVALSFREIERIREHYEVAPEELRLRVYYEPVQRGEALDIFSPLLFQNEVSLVGLPAL